MKYKRRIMVLNLVCFICMLSIPGYATQKAVSGKDGLDKEEKELIQAGLKPFKPKLLVTFKSVGMK